MRKLVSFDGKIALDVPHFYVAKVTFSDHLVCQHNAKS